MIRKILVRASDSQTAAGYERYFKEVIRFHGLKTPALRAVAADLHNSALKHLPFEKRWELAGELFASEFAEEKSIAIDILRRDLKKLQISHLKSLATIIDRHVYDWGTSDSLSGKVIGRMIRADHSLAESLRSWKNSSCLWRQRSACVSFVNMARHGQFDDLILDICKSCIRNPERFVQLGAGWVLREMTLSDRDRTIAFIKKHYRHFSREGLRYAIEKLPDDQRQELLQYRTQC